MKTLELPSPDIRKNLKIKSECMDNNMMSREVILYRRSAMAAIGYKIEMNNSARAKGWLCQVIWRKFEAKLLCFSHTSAIRENSRRSSYAFVIHPPYEKIRREAPIGFRFGRIFVIAKSTEKIRGKAPMLSVNIRHTRNFEVKLLWLPVWKPSHTENIRGEAPIKKRLCHT